MPKPRNPIRPKLLNTSFPEDLFGRLTLHLYSELEQRVPHGAYAAFLQERTREFFATRLLDLAPWAGTDPGTMLVRGTPEVLAVLERTLKGEMA